MNSIFSQFVGASLALALLAGCQSNTIRQSILVGNTPGALQQIRSTGNVDKPDMFGNTPLYYAAQRGNFEVAKALIDKGANVNGRPGAGVVPLIAAEVSGSDAIIDYLITHGANVNAANKAGDTPLHYAAGRQGGRQIQCLLEAGAQVNLCTTNSKTPFMNAVVNYKLTEADLDVFLARGVDVNFQVPKQMTALMMAATFGRVFSAQYLVRHKADLDRKGPFGRTALMVAAASGRIEMCDYLIGAGAKLDLTSDAGQTAMGEALDWSHFDCARRLMEAGASYPKGTNTLQGRYEEALYQKLLADQKADAGMSTEARRQYTVALSWLTGVRAELSKQASKDEKGAASREFWRAFAVTMLEAAAEGAAAGAAGGVAPGRVHSNFRSHAHAPVPRRAVVPPRSGVHPNLPGSRYDVVVTPPLAPLVFVAYVPGGGYGTTAGAVRLRADAQLCASRMQICDRLIADTREATR